MSPNSRSRLGRGSVVSSGNIWSLSSASLPHDTSSSALVPQTMLSPSPLLPQTMLSPASLLPQTMLSPSPSIDPQTMLSPPSPSVFTEPQTTLFAQAFADG